jgi:hypothetical protein
VARERVGVPAHGRGGPAARRVPAGRDLADGTGASRRERVVLACVLRSRLRRSGRTGFSRVIEPEKKGDGKDGAKPEDTASDPKEYFGYKRDLESLCEFMSRWLSENGRWGSPVFIAGESYGGYRVGRLARQLQEAAGIGLNGAILISPALEITSLVPTDYDTLGWVDRVPTMTAAALTTAARVRSGKGRRSRRRSEPPRSSRPTSTRSS